MARNRRSGEYVGVCERVVREVFVNGEARALPYLAGLRVVPGFRHRRLVLRGGFEAVRQLLTEPGDLPWSLTSIMSDNANARRLLGANLKGMPRYEPVGEFSTFALLPSGKTELERATEADLPAIAELLLRHGARSQFAACLAHRRHCSSSRSSGWLKPSDYFVVRDGGAIRACAALWDQSAQRQLVVAGYAPWLRRTRPVINLASRLTGSPRLPAPGEPLRAAYLSLVAVDDDASGDLATAARRRARRGAASQTARGVCRLAECACARRAVARARRAARISFAALRGALAGRCSACLRRPPGGSRGRISLAGSIRRQPRGPQRPTPGNAPANHGQQYATRHVEDIVLAGKHGAQRRDDCPPD